MNEENNQLSKMVNESGLDKTKSQYILDKFQSYFNIAAEWEIKAKTLSVTSDHQVAEIKMAREGRLLLKKKRTDIEKSRKELKEQSLREGKSIDGIASVLKGLIQPIETYLEEQEKYTEIRISKEKDDLQKKRREEFEEAGIEWAFIDLRNMDEAYYQDVKKTRIDIKTKKEEEELKLEAERVLEEKKREEALKENEKLKSDALKREKELQEANRKLKVSEESSNVPVDIAIDNIKDQSTERVKLEYLLKQIDNLGIPEMKNKGSQLILTKAMHMIKMAVELLESHIKELK